MREYSSTKFLIGLSSFVEGTEFRPIQYIQINHNHCSQGSYRVKVRRLTCIHNYTRKWFTVYFIRNVEGEEWKGNSNEWEVTTGWDDDTKYLKRYSKSGTCEMGDGWGG